MKLLQKLKYSFVATFILMYGLSLILVLPVINLQKVVTPITLILTLLFILLFVVIIVLQIKHKTWRPVTAIDYGTTGIMLLYILQIIAKFIA